MGVVKMNCVRDYWATSTFFEPVAEVMTRQRFELLMRYLHLVDNEIADKTTKDWKLKPFLSALKGNCLRVVQEQHEAVDEMSIPYKGKRGPRHYNPAKPSKWHFTVYARAGSSGFIYDFELFTGSHPQPPSSAGVSGDIVLRLSDSLPPNIPYKIFADNYFVSYQLTMKILARGHHFTGTFRTNRVKLQFKDEKAMKREGRGTSDYTVQQKFVYGLNSLFLIPFSYADFEYDIHFFVMSHLYM
jgi:hypothetical protein